MTVFDRMRAKPTGDRAARNGLISFIAVQILRRAIADRARIVAEQRIEGADVVRHERPLVTFEGGPHLGNDVRQVGIHHSPPLSDGLLAPTTPACSSACAMRSKISSRQGAAMICTAIGSGSNGTGTVTTGRPTNEIGWV